MKTTFVMFYFLFLYLRGGKGEFYETYDTIKNVFQDVRYAYDSKETLIPVAFTNITMNVTVDISLASVNSFDVLGGYLEISGYLKIGWTVDLDWDTFTVSTPPNNMSDVPALFRASWIWKPPLLLVNSIQSTAEIGDSTSKVRCNLLSLVCEWEPWIILRGSCTPDVRYYPFDRQSCKYKIAAWGHTASELMLTPTKSTWDMDFYEANAEWAVESTSCSAYTQQNTSFVEYGIELKRIPTYYVINLIAPVVLLALVNVCVFLLPAESGERIGFSITCFLSFVVLLNIVMSLIPASSANIAYLCYFTFIMMIFSCGISLATVFTLWIHFKSEDESSNVPVVLRGFMYMLKCRCFYITPRTNRASNAVLLIKTVDSNWDDDHQAPDYTEKPEKLSKPNDPANVEFTVTWKQVASAMDIVFLLGFLGGQIFYSVGYLLPIILNK